MQTRRDLVMWHRLPVIVRAPAAGIVVAAAGTLVWARLVAANIKHASSVPWSVPVMAVYLYLFWRYFARGDGWPAATGAARRRSARVNAVDGDAWFMALVAGILGLVSVMLLQGVLGRLVTLPQQRDIDPSQYPLGTVALWVVMSALVSGVVEEIAFRGYLQRLIERRHGPVLAIVITGLIFGVAHFTHPEVGVVLLPFYLAVAAVYGGLAYFTDSTVPSVVLHAGGNVLGAMDLFSRGQSEWQLSSVPPKLVWETGADTAFVGTVLAFLVASGLTAAAFAALARASPMSVRARGLDGAAASKAGA